MSRAGEEWRVDLMIAAKRRSGVPIDCLEILTRALDQDAAAQVLRNVEALPAELLAAISRFPWDRLP